MARGWNERLSLQITAGACIGAAFLILVLPLKWVLAVILAAAFHELCHGVAVRLCGGQVLRLRIGGRGALMEATPLPPKKELICALAGPVGGLLLLFTARWIPRIALCGAIHSAYNLLPVYPLDGGRALRCGAEIFLPPEKADKLCAWLERSCILALIGLGIYGCLVLDLGIAPALPAAILLIRGEIGKIPCKPALSGVQ